MKLNDITIQICSSQHEVAKVAQKMFEPFKANIFDGTGYSSLSKIFNEAIVSSPTEIVALCSDRVLPKPSQVMKAHDLLEKGFGVVAMNSLYFFMFKKELIRRIGFFEERLEWGGDEDSDFLRRLKLHDIALYETHEMEVNRTIPSRWKGGVSRKFYEEKWDESNPEYDIKKLREKNYTYDIGQSIPTLINSWNDSILIDVHNGEFKTKKVIEKYE